MIKTSVIEISESALKNNIRFLKSIIGKKCALSSVVKGNAYGHGIKGFVPLVKKCGVNHFSVFSAEEAKQTLDAAGNSCEIMIMGMIDDAELEWAIQNDISFYVFDTQRLEAALAASKKLNKPARIQLELETGMNRLGFNKRELECATAVLSRYPEHFIVEGVCTHYAGAESIANYVRVQKQFRVFENIHKWLTMQGIIPQKKHSACSAAAMTYPKTRMDMVRIGIMQYGFWPSRETLMNFLTKKSDARDPLRRVIAWKSKVMAVKNVNAGEFIGYGTTCMAEQHMKIAIIPVGYAQGYSRSLSNQGRVLIHGHRVNVIGVVNMNMMIADVSYVQQTKTGDEVVLIGKQGKLAISVSSFSELSDQLNYELLTRLPQDIPRIVTQ